MLSKQVKLRIQRNRRQRLHKWAKRLALKPGVDQRHLRYVRMLYTSSFMKPMVAVGFAAETLRKSKTRGFLEQVVSNQPIRAYGETERRTPEFSQWCMVNPLQLGLADSDAMERSLKSDPC